MLGRRYAVAVGRYLRPTCVNLSAEKVVYQALPGLHVRWQYVQCRRSDGSGEDEHALS